MYENIFYQNCFYVIGGVETFLYELARLTKANNRNLTIIYKSGDPEQIARIVPYCRIVKYDSIEHPIKCKKAFFNYALDIIDDVEADEYIQLVHADFKDKSLKNYPLLKSDKITKHIAVSENNAKSFRELTGKDIEVIYNPIDVSDTKKAITLISPQRISAEKGITRLEEMIRRLDRANIPYIWHIFTDGRYLSVDSPNVIYHKPDLNVRSWIKAADYLVLLSDTEGYPYSAYESLCMGVPLIITKLPVLKELGANESNSIIVDFDLSNLDVNEIYDKAGTFNFKYKQKPDGWLKLLGGTNDYEFVAIKVEATIKYFDVNLNRTIDIGERYIVSKERAGLLESKGFAKIIGEML